MEDKEVTVPISELRKVRVEASKYRKKLESLKKMNDALRAEIKEYKKRNDYLRKEVEAWRKDANEYREENTKLKAILEINQERGNC